MRKPSPSDFSLQGRLRTFAYGRRLALLEQDADLCDEAAARISQLETVLKHIRDARLDWAMVCECTCNACDRFYESVRLKQDEAMRDHAYDAADHVSRIP